MTVLRDFLATLYKMFAADLVMSLIALATVGICAAARGLVGAAALPYLLTAGVVVALTIAVLRGSRR